MFTRLTLCCAVLCFGANWCYPYPSGLLYWHLGNLMIAPVPVKQSWRIWVNLPSNPIRKWWYTHRLTNMTNHFYMTCMCHILGDDVTILLLSAPSHYSEVTWVSRRLNSPSTRWFNTLFVSTTNKAPKLAYWLFVQYIPRNMHTVTALLCFVVVIH